MRALLLAAALVTPGATTLDPSNARVSFHATAMGFLPIDGTFDDVTGALALDGPRCTLTLQVAVASLRMASPAREDVLSPALLDAARYPQLRFAGDCDRGLLTLHGQTHPVTLQVRREASGIVVETEIRRADWGITGRPLLAGPLIRIRLAATQVPAAR